MKKFLLICFLFFLVSFSFISAEGENLTLKQDALLCTQSSVEIMNELQTNDFSIQRVNDTLQRAINLYESQSLLEEKGKKADYTLVSDLCDEVSELKDNAFESRDSFNALKMFYSESSAQGDSSMEELFAKIQSEIDSERYEKVPQMIDDAYSQISKLESEKTALNLFYSSTTNILMNLLRANWKWMSILGGFILFILIIYRTAMMRYIYIRKLKNLALRKESLRDLIGQTQKNYFQEGKISEREYEIRTKNFAEMIRDLERQIPLIEEKLVKYGGKRDKMKKVEEEPEKKPKKKEKKVSKSKKTKKPKKPFFKREKKAKKKEKKKLEKKVIKSKPKKIKKSVKKKK